MTENERREDAQGQVGHDRGLDEGMKIDGEMVPEREMIVGREERGSSSFEGSHACKPASIRQYISSWYTVYLH
jgi:hypothetical protein